MGMVYVLLLVVLVTLAVGLAWRWRNGRIRDMSDSAEPLDAGTLAALGVDPGEASVTLLQFSTAFCQPCRATRQVLRHVADSVSDIRHVEVDAESHLDQVRALGVLRTPTVLILDREGRVVRRASGAPRTADVLAAVTPLLPERP